MESGNDGALRQGVLAPVPDSSDLFETSVLAPLQSAYLYEESLQSFRYKSAALFKNAGLEEQYNTFRAEKRKAGYSEEELKETYGFLLFDDINKAHALGATGVLTGNSTCTTLGDPAKGVYISMYSDCLDLNRWYHGKSGHIVIIRLTKGRVKKVFENYTQNFTLPSARFDCHVSEDLPSVSAKTSSFLAFERTQYYVYELLDDGSCETAQCPSAACPFAVVSFSYTDTDATQDARPETRVEKKSVFHYLAWRGQLEIDTQVYNVGIRSAAGALIPVKLPPVVKLDKAISMSDLTLLLPKSAFVTCVSGEVCLGGLYLSLHELVPLEEEGATSFSLLLREMKEKDLALAIPVNDGGFLILLHSSHFFMYDESGSNATEVLLAMFVFPGSRVIDRGTKSGETTAAASSEILQVLPMLSYAEGEVEKMHLESTEELGELLLKHMQTYAAMMSPGLPSSPPKEVSIFPDQYDIVPVHKCLYSPPPWTNQRLQRLSSYLSKPESLQLPLSKASEILAADHEEQREELDDDLYICPSSPDEAPVSGVPVESEDQSTAPKCPVFVETCGDNSTTSEAHVESVAVPENVESDCLQEVDAAKGNTKSDLTEPFGTDNKVVKVPVTRPSDDLSAELIVSITSAEKAVADGSLNLMGTMSAAKHDGFQISDFSGTKLQTVDLNCPHDETVNSKCGDNHEHGHFMEAKPKKPNSPSNSGWRKLRRRSWKHGKLPTRYKATPAEEKNSRQQNSEYSVLKDIGLPLPTKKCERWDLKAVVSECGRILVPHGSNVVVNQIQFLKEQLQSNTDKDQPEQMDVGSVTETTNGVDHLETKDTLVNSEHGGHKDGLSSRKITNNGTFLLSKLKSVLLRGKRKQTAAQEPSIDKDDDTDTCLKKGKVDSDAATLTTNSVILRDQDTNGVAKEVSTVVSVDPLFAYALGLSPIVKPVAGQRNEGQGSPQRTDSPDNQQQPVFHRRTRIKTLKKHQGISAECVKKTWWLHFQTPACFDTETMKHKDSTRDMSVMKTVKEKSSLHGSSAEALNLLADLALGAGKDPVPPQPTLERQPETRLKSYHCTKDVTSAEKESVLHTLLRKPPARPIQTPESPGGVVADGETVGLISQEHNYSFRLFSPLLLGLPGTPFHVLPLSGSTRLLLHHQQQCGTGSETLQPPVCQEDRSDSNHQSKEYLKKQSVHKLKSKRPRICINKDKSVQVTRHWKQSYELKGDWRLASDAKVKTVLRALHGPRDNQDSTKDAQLIVHMWIGLFYSRSTPRFFHIDADLYPEEKSIETSSEMVSAPANTELEANATKAFSKTEVQDESVSKALYLGKKDTLDVDEEPMVLDLSMKDHKTVVSEKQIKQEDVSASDEKKETSELLNTLKPPVVQQQFHTVATPTAIRNEMDIRSSCEVAKTRGPPEKVYTRKRTSLTEGLKTVSVRTEHHQSAATAHVLHGCKKEKPLRKGDVENNLPPTTGLVKKPTTDPSESENVVESNRGVKGVRQTEIEKSASRGHVSHGCNNEKTLKKSDIESNQPPTSLVQEPAMDTLKSEKPVESNIQVQTFLHTENDQSASTGLNREKTLTKVNVENNNLQNQPPTICSVQKPATDPSKSETPLESKGEEVVHHTDNTQSASTSHLLHGRKKEEPLSKADVENNHPPTVSLVQNPAIDPSKSETSVESHGVEKVHQTENDQSASTDHMAQGCYKDKTLTKGDVKNKQPPMICFVQKPATDPSKSETSVESDRVEEVHQTENDQSASTGHMLLRRNKDKTLTKGDVQNKQPPTKREVRRSKSKKDVPSNRGVEGVPQTKEKENRPMEEHLSQEGSQKPEMINSGDDPTNCFEDQNVSSADPKSDTGLPGNDKEPGDSLNVDDCGSDKNVEKDCCISATETDNDRRDQPLPMTRDSCDGVEEGCSKQGNHQMLSSEQPPQVDEGCSSAINLRTKDGNAISLKAPLIAHGMECASTEPAVEENTEKDLYVKDNAPDQKSTLPTSDGSTCSVDGSSVIGSTPQMNDTLEPEVKTTVIPTNSKLNCADRETRETESVAMERKDDHETREETSNLQHLSPHEAMKPKEDLREEVLPLAALEITDKLQKDFTDDAIIHTGNPVQATFPEHKIEGDQKGICFTNKISEPDLPTVVFNAPLKYEGKISALNVSESRKQAESGKGSDERCPTPTLDEKPFEPKPCVMAEIFITKPTKTSPKCHDMSSTPTVDQIAVKQNLSHGSKTHCDPKCHVNQDSDLDLRTLRVLQSINQFLPTSEDLNSSRPIDTGAKKNGLCQSSIAKNINTAVGQSHTSDDLKNKTVDSLKSAEVSASTSTSQVLLKEPSPGCSTLHLKGKSKEAKLPNEKRDSSVSQVCLKRTDEVPGTSAGKGDSHFYRSSTFTECSRIIKPNVPDQNKTSNSILNHKTFSYRHHPDQAVKPSRSDISRTDRIPKSGDVKQSLINKQTTAPAGASTKPTSMSLEKMEKLGENSEIKTSEQESSKSSARPNQRSSRSSSNKASFALKDHSYLRQERKTTSSPQSTHSNKSAKNGDVLTPSPRNNSGKRPKESTEKSQKNLSEASDSLEAHNINGVPADGLMEPQTSLQCTVFNTGEKRPYSFLEQISRRCIQEDATEASIEQEYLIFSEKMRQLMKRRRKGLIEQETHVMGTSCTSPMTVDFSSLGEPDDLVDLLDTPSLVGKQIKVEVSNGKDPEKESQKALPEPADSNNPDEVSDVAAKYAQLYQLLMDDICSGITSQATPKHLGVNRSHKKMDPSNLFDFCGQMKQKMDASFRSSLNSVVKKSLKTKYRFYILVTSEDDIFEETKAQLESVGHTAIQPSDFFLGQNCSLPLLVILRNEDIAENISKVPHLLELKKSPDVQFAGIDEPNDVVNLTHQELFTRGGFLMFDRAALEALSICNMKKCWDILHELSRTGKWKWMLHYRDSRQLKENARLSAEAKEKQCFLNLCNDKGILEVLPYHECDVTSRDRPDYLTCLVRLQVHNISARYPVFITDETTDDAFGRNGIFTMTVDTFLSSFPHETFESEKSDGSSATSLCK